MVVRFWYPIKEVAANVPTAVERGGNTLNGVKDFRTGNGSMQGQNLKYWFQVRSTADTRVPSGCGMATESGTIFKAHRLVHHSTLGWRGEKKKIKKNGAIAGCEEDGWGGSTRDGRRRPATAAATGLPQP